MRLKSNLETRGRLVRGSAGAALLVGAIILWDVSWIAGLCMILSAGFLLFEALKGWCALRACGFKTKW